MMTIKVIQLQGSDVRLHPVIRPVTHLYEGERIQHKYVDFKNREEFLKKYNNIVEGLGDAHVTGIPQEYWKEKQIEPGMFLCIYYSCGDKLERCIIVQNSIVYITQGGQTVDKIHC